MIIEEDKFIFNYIVKNIHLRHYPHLIALFVKELKGEGALDFLKKN